MFQGKTLTTRKKMKFIKYVLLSLLGIVVLVLLTGLFLKKEYSVKRDINIDKPASMVFEYVKYLKNQENYSVWSRMDTSMKKEFKGTDGSIGFISAWDSENPDVGKGEQEITGIIENNRIDYELRFIEPWESKDHTYLITESTGDSSTKVVWGFDGKMKYPMNITMLFMDFDKMLGDDLEEGLKNLKEVLEKTPNKTTRPK